MDFSRCPVCDHKIGLFQKYWQSTWGKGIVECPSCKSKLTLKQHGTGRANAGLIVIVLYFFLGIKEWYWLIPLGLLGMEILTFIQKSLTHFSLYDPEQKNGGPGEGYTMDNCHYFGNRRTVRFVD